MNYRAAVPAAVAIALVLASHAAPKRPALLAAGAHTGLKTDDLAAARQFYGTYLGFEEPFTLDKPFGGLMLTYFKVNDHQYSEVFPELQSPPEHRLPQIAV